MWTSLGTEDQAFSRTKRIYLAILKKNTFSETYLRVVAFLFVLFGYVKIRIVYVNSIVIYSPIFISLKL